MSPIFSLVSSVRTSSGLEAGDENAATKALCIAPNDVIPRNIPLQIDSIRCVEVLVVDVSSASAGKGAGCAEEGEDDDGVQSNSTAREAPKWRNTDHSTPSLPARPAYASPFDPIPDFRTFLPPESVPTGGRTFRAIFAPNQPSPSVVHKPHESERKAKYSRPGEGQHGSCIVKMFSCYSSARRNRSAIACCRGTMLAHDMLR